MKFEFRSGNKTSKNKRYVYYIFLSLLLSFIQLVGLDFIEIGGITPDLLLILVVWISLREGRFVGMISGFTVGFIFDLISLDTLGTNALAKLLVAFLAGTLYREGKENLILGSFRFLIYVFLCAVLNNIIYFTLRIKFVDFSLQAFLLKYALAFSFYTTILAIFPMFYAANSKRDSGY